MAQQNLIFRLMAAALLSLIVAACQTLPYQPQARDVKRKPGKEGVVALNQNHRPEDRALAEKMMTQNCSGKEVKVIEEGEVVIGEKTKSTGSQSHDAGEQKRQAGTLFGLPLMTGRNASTESSSESEKVQMKEWQISYECDLGKGSVKR